MLKEDFTQILRHLFHSKQASIPLELDYEDMQVFKSTFILIERRMNHLQINDARVATELLNRAIRNPSFRLSKQVCTLHFPLKSCATLHLALDQALERMEHSQKQRHQLRKIKKQLEKR